MGSGFCLCMKYTLFDEYVFFHTYEYIEMKVRTFEVVLFTIVQLKQRNWRKVFFCAFAVCGYVRFEREKLFFFCTIFAVPVPFRSGSGNISGSRKCVLNIVHSIHCIRIEAVCGWLETNIKYYFQTFFYLQQHASISKQIKSMELYGEQKKNCSDRTIFFVAFFA